jgi:catechol 2,3-dioxygenase-like lactoylglutathione lyase family enzyme
MGQTNPAQIKIPSLHLIGIVVKDVQKTADDYWKLLGIGPWAIFTSRSYDQTYRGNPAQFSYKIGLAQVGQAELELMETLDGPTTYRDFMAQYGEGGHHLQYLVDNVSTIDMHAEIMAQNGYPSLMSGHSGSNGGFNYFDTVSALGTIWESVKMADEFEYPAYEGEPSPAELKVAAITQVGLVVRELQTTVDNYSNIFGIGPWEISELAPPLVYDSIYKGKPTSFSAKVACATAGEIQIELIEPHAGSNIFKDFLAKHGGGIHHIGFSTDNIAETTRLMNKEGFPTLMSFSLGNSAIAYYDTCGLLKCVWKVFQASDNANPRSVG